MATGYSREQLAALTLQMDADAPPPLITEDLGLAEPIVDAGMAGTDLGILLRLAGKGDDFTNLFLNCVLVLKLVFCIFAARDANGWRLTEDQHMAKLRQMPPTEADLAAAWRITSLHLGSDRQGAMLAATDGVTTRRFFIRRKLLAALLAIIAQANDRAGWWGDSWSCGRTMGANCNNKKRTA